MQLGKEAVDAASFIQCINPPEPIYRIILTFLTPALVSISATIAWFAMRNARALARQKATLDLIEKNESTQHYRDISATFSKIRKDGKLLSIEKAQTDDEKKSRQDVMDYLNHYELVSIGIRQGILDAKIYQAWMLSVFIRDWNAAADLIQAERWRLNDEGTDWVYHEKVFASYGWLAEKWSSDARVLRKDRKPPMPEKQNKEFINPGDDPLPVTQAVPLDGKGATPR